MKQLLLLGAILQLLLLGGVTVQGETSPAVRSKRVDPVDGPPAVSETAAVIPSPRPVPDATNLEIPQPSDHQDNLTVNLNE